MNINEIKPYLDDKYILKMGKDSVIYLKDNIIVLKNKNTKLNIKYEDFIFLYKDYEFALIEKNTKTFDEEKDNEYYHNLINRK